MTSAQLSCAYLFSIIVVLIGLSVASRRLGRFIDMAGAVMAGAVLVTAFAFAHAQADPPLEAVLHEAPAFVSEPMNDVTAPVPAVLLPAKELQFNLDVFQAADATPTKGTVVMLEGGHDVTAAGWAFDTKRHATCSLVLALVDSRWGYGLDSGLSRPDVGEAFRDARYVLVGFSGSFGALLSRGPHVARFVCVLADGSAEVAPIARRLLIH